MRPQIPPDHFRVIAARFPGVTANEIEAHAEGHDHAVYIIRRQATVRFPRAPRRINLARKRFLDAFAPLAPILVPRITIHYDAHLASDYELNVYLPGEPLTPALASGLSSEARDRIAGELGDFLTALHSFPLAAARALAVDELDPTTFGAYMAENPHAYPYLRRMVFPALTPDQQRWVERLFGDYVALVKERPFPVCVTHSDMWAHHILVDPGRALLTGVLDYWPRIADPARDFKAFEQYGADFCAAVYRAYGLPRDDSFELRRLFYT